MAYFVHFTSPEDAAQIVESGMLWGCSYLRCVSKTKVDEYGHAVADANMAPVFAVAVGGIHVPGVQLSVGGRTQDLTAAVLFECDEMPDFIAPEEVVWDRSLAGLVITDPVVVTAEEAIECLDDSAGLEEPSDIPPSAWAQTQVLQWYKLQN